MIYSKKAILRTLRIHALIWVFAGFLATTKIFAQRQGQSQPGSFESLPGQAVGAKTGESLESAHITVAPVKLDQSLIPPNSSVAAPLSEHRVFVEGQKQVPLLPEAPASVEVVATPVPFQEPPPSPTPEEIKQRNAQRLDRIVSLIKSLDTVRVYFADAPGFGHQMATLSIVRRLRDLGYQGAIDGLYFDGASRYRSLREPDIPVKLQTLIPGFDAENRSDQTIPEFGLTLKPVSSFLAKKAPVPLALTGGFDTIESFVTDVEHSIGRQANLADLFDSDFFLHLGPWGWKKYADSLWVRGEKQKGPIKEDDSDMPILYNPYRPANMEQGLQYSAELLRRAGATPAKIQGVLDLIRRADQHEFLPIYGLKYTSAEDLHRVLMGVAYSMEQHPEVYTGRGVVVPVLYERDQQMQALKEIVADPKATIVGFDRLPAERQQLIEAVNQRLRDHLEMKSIVDPDLVPSLEALSQNKIVLINVGPLPPQLFEWLYSMATLPPTLEGANLTTLVRILGIPFLPVGFAPLVPIMRLIPDSDVRTHNLVDNIRTSRGGVLNIADELYMGAFNYAFDGVAAYIAEAMRPDSALRKAFQEAKFDLASIAHDKLLAALETLALIPKDVHPSDIDVRR